MQQYQPNMVQNGQPQMTQEMQQYQQPQLPQMSLPQMPQMPQMGQMNMMPYQQQMQMQQMHQQLPDLVKIESGNPITNENFHFLRLTCDEPEKEVIAGTGPKADPPNSKPAQYYYNLPLKSNYGNFQEKDSRTFYYESCELTTLYGVKSEMNQFGKFKSSIAFSIDERVPEQVKFLSDFDTIGATGAQFVSSYKDKVNFPLFNNDTPKMAQATGFKPMVTRKVNKNPALYCDLIDYTGDTYSAKTTFTYGNGKVFDWKDLKGMTFKCIPLFRFKKIYVGGGKAAIQYDIKSAIVTSEPVPFKAVSMQANTAKRIAEQRPDWEDTIEAQIARNNMLNQDKKLGAELYIAPKDNIVNNINSMIENVQQSAQQNVQQSAQQSAQQNVQQSAQQNVQQSNEQSVTLEQFMNNGPPVQFS